MRQTRQIDDPKWDDITDRDAVIRKLANIVAGQFERNERPDAVLILDSLDDALKAIDGTEESHER